MTDVSNIGDVYNWSVAKIAEAFGMDRKAVKRRLLEANIPIAATVRGNPVYALRNVGPVLFGGNESAEPGSIHDPEQMEPKERKDWYQSENERLKLEKEQRKLVPVDEVVFVYSSMRKAVVQVLETIPDILERDCGLTPHAVGMVQKSIDDLRYTLQEKTYAACAAELMDNDGGEPAEEG